MESSINSDNSQEAIPGLQDIADQIDDLGWDLAGSAKASGALVRRREIQTAKDLLRMVLVYCLTDWSLDQVGMWALLQGIGSLSKVAVRQRLRNSSVWMGQLVGLWLQQRCAALQQLGGLMVRLMDATVISRSGSPGTGWRVHLLFDLLQLRVAGLELTDAHGGETLARIPPQPGEIRIADRGYAFLSGIVTLLATAYLVLRINWQNLPLYQLDGQRFDLPAWLKTLTHATECWVMVKDGPDSYPLRLLACPLPPEARQAAIRRARRAATKKKHQLHPNTLLAAGFLLLLTNLPADPWSLQQVLWLYRLRWQVELYFKRLKSILTIDHLRAQDDALAQTYLLGKLLAALLLDDLLQQTRLQQPDWFLDLDRPVSIWRLTHLWWSAFVQLVVGPITLTAIFRCLPALRRYLTSPPRDRPQQLALAQAILEHFSFSPPHIVC